MLAHCMGVMMSSGRQKPGYPHTAYTGDLLY